MPEALSVTVVTSLSEVLRDSATATVLWEAPGTALLRYDLGPGREHGLRRVLVAPHDPDAVGVDHLLGAVQHEHLPLAEDDCLGCALRADVLEAVTAVAHGRRARHLVLALPAGGETVPVLQALALEGCVEVTSVVAVCDGTRVADDLLGDDLLSERGVDPGCGEDSRAVGEALAHQLDEADLVLLAAEPSSRDRTLLRHVTAPGTVVAALHASSAADLVTARRGASEARSADPCAARPSGVPDAHGVFTLDLLSPRPLHPHRLLEEIEAVGAGRLRGRGVFWVPSRPRSLCAWDGAGGQLSIGEVGRWDVRDGAPRTRLVITGDDPADARRVRAAFQRALAAPHEVGAWTGGDDGLEPWLGPLDAGSAPLR